MSENKIQQSDEADDEIYYKSPLKSKSRWGWGWFILFLSYSSWYKKAAIEPNAISYILVPIAMFVCYFWLRTRMIGMFNKLWKVSFVAGIIALFVGGFLAAIFDTTPKRSDLEAVAKKYYEKAKSLEQEEKKLISAFVQEPKSAEDLRLNINKIDEYLVFAEQKHNIARSMFNEYKELHNKDKLESIARLETLGNRQFETQKKAWEALKKYYLTGNKSFYNEYSKLENEADKLKTQYQNMDKDFLLK